MNNQNLFAKVCTARRRSGLFSLLMAVWIPLVSVPPAWSSVTGSISGTVKDPSSGVIPGATVTALKPSAASPSTE